MNAVSIFLPAFLFAIGLLFNPWREEAPITPERIQQEEGRAPFLPGERAIFEIVWKPPLWLFFIPPLKAGTVVMEVNRAEGDRPDLARLITKVDSSGAFKSLSGIQVSNVYESLLDTRAFCSR